MRASLAHRHPVTLALEEGLDDGRHSVDHVDQVPLATPQQPVGRKPVLLEMFEQRRQSFDSLECQTDTEGDDLPLLLVDDEGYVRCPTA